MGVIEEAVEMNTRKHRDSHANLGAVFFVVDWKLESPVDEDVRVILSCADQIEIWEGRDYRLNIELILGV